MIIKNNDPYTQPSFSLGNRVGRLLWSFVWLILFRFSPTPMYTWRNFLLRCFGAKIASGVHIYPSVVIWAPWNLSVGKMSGIGPGCYLYTMASIFIGDYVVVSQRSHLCAGTHDYESQNFQLYAKSISIGNRAWICTEAFVGPGVQVGSGAVVGARAVVVRNVAPWVVCAGNPAVYVKDRKIRFDKAN